MLSISSRYEGDSTSTNSSISKYRSYRSQAKGIAKTSKKTSKPTPAVDDAFDIGNAIDDVIEAPLQPQIAVVEPVALDREPDASVVKA